MPPSEPAFPDLGLAIPPELLGEALTHASYANETGLPSNERLEFLGDAVLTLAVTELLFRHFPEREEGELTKVRAVVVSRPVLAEVARRLGLGPHLRVGRGAEAAGARDRPSVLAAALEALLGAAFLAHGYAPVRDLVEKLLAAEIRRYAQEVPDYKSLLQEFVQERFGSLPEYRVVAEEGPEHKKVFTVEAVAGGRAALGRGRSKKEAEQAAAKRLYLALTTPETPEALAA
ncbi:MAG: ribonuclease III [Candidatus Bipolaricaulota bacterium]|nr:ribonuclease III [Candidatus Bipolaricaulota bacterium]MCX7844776.1 ribonuclease III [Candidatus Bipolaricaulota bacterium]MDW8152477.1 ribonuclease III [Candidatus Bipolaricaulota bacterium]